MPVTLWDSQNEEVPRIASLANEMVLQTKRKQNREHNEVTKIFMQLPTYILGLLTTVCSYLSLNVGIGIKPLNVRAPLIQCL